MVKNYTSQVSAINSVNHIEKRLVSCGATDILKLYEDKKLSGIAFIIVINEKRVPFRLPARIDKIEKKLTGNVKRPRKGTVGRIHEQAERTAWKLLSDWVDIQISLIELDQAELMEVFLPYAYDHSKQETLYDKYKANDFKMLDYKG